jgi:hypothetical protein
MDDAREGSGLRILSVSSVNTQHGSSSSFIVSFAVTEGQQQRHCELLRLLKRLFQTTTDYK